jgi:hypothetical protein
MALTETGLPGQGGTRVHWSACGEPDGRRTKHRQNNAWSGAPRQAE